MTRYRKVAVFGATGRVGREGEESARDTGVCYMCADADIKPVTRALAEEGFDVVPISRQETVRTHPPHAQRRWPTQEG